MRSTNLIEDFDAEFDEDYLPPPPVLAREDATSQVWSVLPEPLEIIPNFTTNFPEPSNTIIYNTPSPEENNTTWRGGPEEDGIYYFADVNGNTYAVDEEDYLYSVRYDNEGCDYILVGTWNTEEGVPVFYPEHNP